MSTFARVEGEAKVLIAEQAFSVGIEPRRYHWKLLLGKFQGELVFFDDLLICPAGGAIKLGDQRFAILNADLIDTVFVTIEGKDPAVTIKPLRFDRIHDKAGGQTVERVLVGCLHLLLV